MRSAFKVDFNVIHLLFNSTKLCFFRFFSAKLLPVTICLCLCITYSSCNDGVGSSHYIVSNGWTVVNNELMET